MAHPPREADRAESNAPVYILVGLVFLFTCVAGPIYLALRPEPDTQVGRLVSTPRPTLTPTLTDLQREAQAADAVSYEDLMRYPTKWEAQMLHLRGKVVDVIRQDDRQVRLRVEITEGAHLWDDDIYVWTDSPPAIRLLEGDVILFYAEGDGLFQYTTVLGAGREIPSVRLTRFVEIEGG